MPAEPRALDNRLDFVSNSPGVYLMKDAAGAVIYVGKANQLRQRLRSYFAPKPQGNARVLALISHIADFSVIVCDNEREALVLESTLIKRHQPKYNILLRDDKDYPYIRITMNEAYPRALKAFRIGPDQQEGARYFGPYLSRDVKLALEAIRSIFPIKTCRRVFPRDIGKERACLQYFIGRCIGPCQGHVPAEDYRAVMAQICRFFEGRTDDLVRELRQDMQAASEALDYEKAARIRDRVQALEHIMEKRQVVDDKPVNRDVLALFGNGSELCLQKLQIRRGRLIGSSATFWPDEDQPPADLIRSFLLQHYPQTDWIPPQILVSDPLEDADELAQYLSDLRGKRCQIRTPQRGKGLALVRLARDNARESLRRHTLQGGLRRTAIDETLKLLASVLALDKPPHRIEAYDVSHQAGSDQAASLVVFLDGRPSRRHYRHFRLDQEQVDDYQALRQALDRRLNHLDDEAFGQQPDLLLVDGGLGHVRAFEAVLTQRQISCPVAGLVKDQRHKTRGLVLPDGRTIDLRSHGQADQGLQVADREEDPADGLNPDERLALLRLMTAIQEEAHRFANRLRSSLDRKRQTRFSLEHIPGIGPARRRLLLQAFQSLKKVSEASLDELEAVVGLGKRAAAAVYQHFHPEEESAP